MGVGRLQTVQRPNPFILSPVHGQTKLGYFWITLSPGGDVVYHWRPAAGQAVPESDRGRVPGTLQCDAYVA
jgi:hypothetical protein